MGKCWDAVWQYWVDTTVADRILDMEGPATEWSVRVLERDMVVMARDNVDWGDGWFAQFWLIPGRAWIDSADLSMMVKHGMAEQTGRSRPSDAMVFRCTQRFEDYVSRKRVEDTLRKL